MAATTWREGMVNAVSPSSRRSSYTPVVDHQGDDDDPDGGMSPPPGFLDTLVRQNLRLLLLGVASNMVAFGIDKSIAHLWVARAQAAPQASSIALSYLSWTASALILC